MLKTRPISYVVYYLCDLQGQVRYVGATCNPSQRLQQHLSGHVGGQRLRDWIKGLLPDTPTMKVQCVICTQEEAERVETELIALQRKCGAALLNTHLKGNGDFPEDHHSLPLESLLTPRSPTAMRARRAAIRHAIEEGSRMWEVEK